MWVLAQLSLHCLPIPPGSPLGPASLLADLYTCWAHFPPAARVIFKNLDYHLAYLLKIVEGLPVPLKVGVQIPNDATGFDPGLPFQPLPLAGSFAPSWPSYISLLRAFAHAIPAALDALSGVSSCFVSQVSA